MRVLATPAPVVVLTLAAARGVCLLIAGGADRGRLRLEGLWRRATHAPLHQGAASWPLVPCLRAAARWAQG